MRLSISNIAWEPTQDTQMAKLLRAHGVDAIDVAPSKYFQDFSKADSTGCAEVRNWWADQGIEITGMQALMFGTAGLNVFGTPEVQAQMLSHLTQVCRIGAWLHAPRLVFGSPKCRDRSGLSDQDTQQQAVFFFEKLGNIAHDLGVIICLEPNPSCYGSNFMLTSAETAEIVRQIDHPAVRMQLDTGAIQLADESIDEVIQAHQELIGHVHLSEPQLAPFGESKTSHSNTAKALSAGLPNHIACIEMLSPKNDDSLQAIDRALEFATTHFRIT